GFSAMGQTRRPRSRRLHALLPFGRTVVASPRTKSAAWIVVVRRLVGRAGGGLVLLVLLVAGCRAGDTPEAPTALPTALPQVENPNPLLATAVAATASPVPPPAGTPSPDAFRTGPSPLAAAGAQRGNATPVRRVRPATPTAMPAPTGDRGFKSATLLVDPDGLQRRLGDPRLRVIDARPAEDYAAGHVPGAVNLGPQWLVDISAAPALLLTPQGFKAEMESSGVGSDAEIVVYDDDGGLWAARVLWALNAYGVGRASLLEGGFQAWQAAGKPAETAAVQPAEATFEPRADARVWMSAEEVRKVLNDPGVVIVDARSEEEYRGKLRLAARAGRLPGAVHRYWREDLRADGQYFKSAAELEQDYRALGVTPEKTVIVYCQTGVRAAHVYLALKLIGYPNVRVYDGGWHEWGNLANMPIDREDA
ncbi:MAG TPA: rhodanese-like domain-containing protein, partial [Dehalococcoidia bacterium]|nr:rhodanese-like domain-containing protein [Dehalococcoidia bacterium]